MQRKKQKTVPAEQDWAVLEEKFNDLLTPILGYAEFLQMQLGPESELYQDAREIEFAAGQLQALFQEISSHHRLGSSLPPKDNGGADQSDGLGR